MDFSLEKWQPSFAGSVTESANDACVARFLRDSFPYPYTRKNAEDFIAFAQGETERGGYYRAIVVGGKAVGGIAVTRGQDVCRRSGEIGYWLTPACWGKGIMTGAVRTACEEVFENTDIVRVYAEVFAPNAASCRVLEKNGFAKEGIKRKSVFKNGAFYDSIVYARIKE